MRDDLKTNRLERKSKQCSGCDNCKERCEDDRFDAIGQSGRLKSYGDVTVQQYCELTEGAVDTYIFNLLSDCPEVKGQLQGKCKGCPALFCDMIDGKPLLSCTKYDEFYQCLLPFPMEALIEETMRRR